MMKRQIKAWEARLIVKSRVVTRRQRNGPVVAGLVLSTVLLAIVGLAVEPWFVPGLAILVCYGPAIVSGIVSLAFLFIERLWIIASPRP